MSHFLRPYGLVSEQKVSQTLMGEQYSHLVSEFRGVPAPEPLRPVGYAALIAGYQLKVPLPRTLAGIATRHHPASTPEWRVLTPRHQPNDDLYGHLEFALKWEGVNLPSAYPVVSATPDILGVVEPSTTTAGAT